MPTSKSVFGLKELILPLSRKEFLENHWLSNEWAYIKSDIKRFKRYSFVSKLLSVHDFAQKYKGRVSLIHRDKPALDVEGGVKALPFLEKGYTIYFRDVEDYFPMINKVVKQLAADLNMPKMTSEIFASSGKSGVGMHSDYHLNLNLLLSGKKEWLFAKNTALVNQTSICMPKGKKQVDQSQLKYLSGKLDAQMPFNAKRVTQNPGDLMFVPRGWWHSTISYGECVSVNFIFKDPTWARLFASALEAELLNDPQWRDFPYNLNSKIKSERDVALKHFQNLVDKYQKSLLNKSSDNIAKILK